MSKVLRSDFGGGLIAYVALLCACSQPERSAPSADLAPAAPARTEQSSPSPAADLQRGQQLFGAYCATCHGDKGAGDGQAAYLLSPAPRNFTQARFRLASSVNGVPTDTDLVATLRRGMPGSAMPAWEWMSDSDLASLAAWVRRLAFDGKTEALLARAKAEDEEMSRDEALEIATRALTPGEPIAIPASIPNDAASLHAGRRLYLKTCALCHDADGTARGVEDQWNEDGTPNQPRDFTAGVLKGGSGFADIVRRLSAGLPGSPMPASKFEGASDVAELAAYVQSLIKPGSQDRGVQTRRTVHAHRVASVPHDAADPAWNGAEAVYLPLMPLWWREPRVEGFVVRALHDGTSIALRMSWEDATHDDELLGQDTFGDAAGLQWSSASNPPLFTMGVQGQPVNIWLWKAAWERDLARVRDVADRYPSTPADMYGHTDGPHEGLYLTASSAGNRMASRERRTAGEALTAQGFGTLAPIQGAENGLGARGQWADGFYDAVFVRELGACCEGELALAPGARVFLAGAVWDGAARDRNGQKSVTVWHAIELEP